MGRHEGHKGEHTQAGHQGEMDWRGEGLPAQVQPDQVEQHIELVKPAKF